MLWFCAINSLNLSTQFPRLVADREKTVEVSLKANANGVILFIYFFNHDTVQSTLTSQGQVKGRKKVLSL